jgi:riboflavin synthase
MFTGIIENLARVVQIAQHGSGIDITFNCALTNEMYIDQSIAHNGICLTITEINEPNYKVTAVKETIEKTNISNWKSGDYINLERAMISQGRVDGHLVQGHVDSTAICDQIIDEDGSWSFWFSIEPRWLKYLVPKGSICINGVSLTLVNIAENRFSVAIIPYTYEHTNFSTMLIGDKVNIEVDIIGKYVVNYLERTGLGK